MIGQLPPPPIVHALILGSSGTFMSGGSLALCFLPQRRSGAEKKSEEPHKTPMPFHSDFGMGAVPSTPRSEHYRAGII